MEADLLQAVFAKVKAIAGGLGLPCYWPNVAPPTAPANVHIRVDILPTRPSVIGTGGKARRKWLLQVAVWVRDGIGVVAPAATGDAIAAGLPFGLVLAGASHTYTITGQAEAVTPVTASGWYATPYQFEVEHLD